MTFCVVRVSLTFKKAAELPGCFIIKLKPSLYSKTVRQPKRSFSFMHFVQLTDRSGLCLLDSGAGAEGKLFALPYFYSVSSFLAH